MNKALAQLKALRREKLRPQELTKPTKDTSVSFVSSDGSSLHGDGKASVSFVSGECRQDYKGQTDLPSAPVDEVEKRTQHTSELTKPTKDTSVSFVSCESDRPLGKHSDFGAQSIEGGPGEKQLPPGLTKLTEGSEAPLTRMPFVLAGKDSMPYDLQYLAPTEQYAAPIAAITAPDNGAPSSNTALLRPTRDGWTAEDWQAFFDERAAIAEFDGELPRPQAEALAFECCVIERQNRNRIFSSPGRCVCCGGVERPGAPALLAIGTKGEECAWLHSTCWETWYRGRRADAVAALSALGISNPGDHVSVKSLYSPLQPVTVIYQELCKPNGLGKTMRVMLGDRELSRGANPMGSACRRLVSEGYSPEQTIQAYWEGSQTPIWAAGTKLKRWTNRSVKKKSGSSEVAGVDQVGDES